jgi:hypothetical protein
MQQNLYNKQINKNNFNKEFNLEFVNSLKLLNQITI